MAIMLTAVVQGKSILCGQCLGTAKEPGEGYRDLQCDTAQCSKYNTAQWFSSALTIQLSVAVHVQYSSVQQCTYNTGQSVHVQYSSL